MEMSSLLSHEGALCFDSSRFFSSPPLRTAPATAKAQDLTEELRRSRSREWKRIQRQDPRYREAEREKDRLRKQRSRTSLHVREKERIRDRERKKMYRADPSRRQYEKRSRKSRTQHDTVYPPIGDSKKNLHLSREYPNIVAKEEDLGPTDRCSCCGCLFFRSDIFPVSPSDVLTFPMVAKMSENRRNAFLQNVYCYGLDETQPQFCNICFNDIRYGEIPRGSLAGGDAIPDIPECLVILNEVQ